MADPCYLCNGESTTFDHIEPWVEGGSNGQDNIARACERCNTRKGSTPLLLYLALVKQRELEAERETERLRQKSKALLRQIRKALGHT